MLDGIQKTDWPKEDGDCSIRSRKATCQETLVLIRPAKKH